MSKNIKIKKGLDLKLIGKADTIIENKLNINYYALKPSEFKNITPKVLVKQGDLVKVGTALFSDKNNSDILFTAPVSGEITDIIRGERRILQEIIIKADKKLEYEKFEITDTNSNEQIINTLLKSGLWTTIIQRPYSIIANPKDKPKAIHISTFESAPLAPDYEFILKEEIKYFQSGISTLSKICNKIYLNNSSKVKPSIFSNITNCEINTFEGPHPAGNVGIQIHHLNPINKGEIVWTINVQNVVQIGKLFELGIYDSTKIIALSGSEITTPQYFKIYNGANIEQICENKVKGTNPRYISGNVLTGSNIGKKGFIGFYDNQISVIPEGNYPEFLGWLSLGLKKFSTSKSYFSWLTPKKEFELNTNLNGGNRAYVVTGQFEKVLPMDIYPMQLIKAIIVEDIDMMENLGIYEVAAEDFALCEFVCTSKTNIQETIENGINLMLKQMS
jgi:Na+-transporting NADH:ubiquinone oxidoreductase subunit A